VNILTRECNKILVLSPHTDDAELGSGGSISRFIENNAIIHWVVFSSAEESLPADMARDTLTKEFMEVASSLGLGAENVDLHHFSVRKLAERRQDVLDILVSLRREFAPDMVIGPSLNDYHQDHAVVANEMIRAFKMSSSIICYELPWNQVSFESQLFIRLEDKHMESKLNMLKKYESQIHINRGYFTEDFIKGLGYTRGAQVGHKFAEAFEVVRWMI